MDAQGKKARLDRTLSTRLALSAAAVPDTVNTALEGAYAFAASHGIKTLRRLQDTTFHGHARSHFMGEGNAQRVEVLEKGVLCPNYISNAP